MFIKSKLLSTTILSAVLGGALLLSSCNGSDTPQEPDNTKVLATSDAGKITQKNVDDLKKMLPPQYLAMPDSRLTPMLLEELITESILDKEGNKRKLKDSAEYKKEVAKIEKQALRKIVIEKLSKEAVTDEAIKSAYDKMHASTKPVLEVRARHILVKTKKQASSILAQLKKGGDFAKLAMKNSTGPTGKTGGELGWFSKEKMVPEFSAVAFKLKDKEFGLAKTSFGWHVIQREEHRIQPVPPLDDKMKASIRSQLAPQALQALVKKLRDASHVKNIYEEELVAKEKKAQDDADAKAKTTDTSSSDSSNKQEPKTGDTKTKTSK